MATSLEQDITALVKGLKSLANELEILADTMQDIKSPNSRKDKEDEYCDTMAKEEADYMATQQLNGIAIALAQSNKMDQAKKMLQTKFGLGTLHEADEERYEDVIEELIQLLKDQ